MSSLCPRSCATRSPSKAEKAGRRVGAVQGAVGHDGDSGGRRERLVRERPIALEPLRRARVVDGAAQRAADRVELGLGELRARQAVLGERLVDARQRERPAQQHVEALELEPAHEREAGLGGRHPLPLPVGC